MLSLYMIIGLLAIIREIDMKIDVEQIKLLVEKLNEAKILVIGDLALDEMVYGDTERIFAILSIIAFEHLNSFEFCVISSIS